MKQRANIDNKKFSTPFYFFVLAVVLILVAESLVMILLASLPDFSLYKEALIDSLFLSIIIIPTLYLLLFRPLILHIKERTLAEKKLEEAHEVLEMRVEERTKELTLEIAERKKAEDEIRSMIIQISENEKRLRTITDSAADAIIQIDAMGRVVFWNKAAEKIFEYTAEEIAGKELSDFIVPEEHMDKHRNGLKKFRESGEGPLMNQTHELPAVRKDGTEFPIEMAISAVRLGEEWHAVGVLRDISERKKMEEAIRQMAYYDSLTGLPNRLLFRERLDQLLLREKWKKRSAAVLFLDLDRFKTINDSLGHTFGDELLKVVAIRLEKCLREGDTVARLKEGDTVARLGGDEFTILLQDLAKTDDISLVLEKILNAIKQPIEINGQEVFISASIGVSVFPDDGEDSDTLLKNADIAMYRAKSEGKNTFQLYTSAMSIKAIDILKIEQRLSKALKKNEFVLHYQPEMELRTGEIVGMEALVRLEDREDGKLTPPGAFIPVAEETGIIIPLSEWILRMACEHNKSYQDAGYPPIRVAVNISPRVFKQRNFVPMVADILKESGLNPEYLEIEITEETLLTDAEDTIKTMNALKKIGVKFAIDDFGTGYSSLSYIKMLPINLLKIDRAFVRDINSSADDKAIVMAIIQMAHSMGLEVLAEGVETEEQLELLHTFGCDKLQGYLLSKPVPFPEFEKILKKTQSFKKYFRNVIKVS